MARDHFGNKPLFYTSIKGGFAFSSELKSLTSIPGFDKSINDDALLVCMSFLWILGQQTIFTSCSKLAPAYTMRLAPDQKIKMTNYWKLTDKVQNFTEKEAVNALLKELKYSLDRHLVSDVPVSSFLSGGLDSSLISVIASKYLGKLSTYTIAISNLGAR